MGMEKGRALAAGAGRLPDSYLEALGAGGEGGRGRGEALAAAIPPPVVVFPGGRRQMSAWERERRLLSRGKQRRARTLFPKQKENSYRRVKKNRVNRHPAGIRAHLAVTSKSKA